MTNNPICAILQGSLSGATKQGALTPITLAYSLEAQAGHQQLSAAVDTTEAKTITLPINLGGPVASPSPLSLLLITCDVAQVEITLNSAGTPVGPFLFPKAAGFLVLPGQVGTFAVNVPVSDILIDNKGSQRATVSVTAIYG
jgi:hypothetical protein